MSDASDAITATILLADFANISSDGKLNLIGGGIQLLGFNPEQGLTAAFTVYVGLSSPMPLDGAPAVEILLADASGNVVQLPGPAGEPQALRISQNVEFSLPAVVGLDIPKGALPSTSQFVIGFTNGLPLQVGHSYTWRVQVDHEVIASKTMYLPAPTPLPVLG